MACRAAALAVLAAGWIAPAAAGAQAPPPADAASPPADRESPGHPPPPVDREGPSRPPPPVDRGDATRPPPPARPETSARPPPSNERGPTDADGPVPGYCQYVKGAAAAEAAVLMAPNLFTSFGVLNTGEATGGTALGEPRGRFQLGLEYDLFELWRGFELKDRADALCRRYRAQRALEVAALAGAEVGAGPALAARARVLAEALPTAEALVESMRGDVREALATIDELDVVRLRLDHLRSEARNALLAQRRLEAMPHADGGSLAEVIAAYRAADDELEGSEGSLRALDAWSLELRGGYDEILDVDQRTPFFGLATLRFDLGALWVGSANSRAREGRRRWTEEEVTSADRRVAELLGQLRTVRDAEAARLEEVTVLVNDLAAQLRDVQRLETARVRRYESFLFFELTRLRGEQAYLQAHLEEIDRIIGITGL